MVNLITIAVACVSVWYEATHPNAAAGFSIKRRRASLGPVKQQDDDNLDF